MTRQRLPTILMTTSAAGHLIGNIILRENAMTWSPTGQS